MQAATPTKAVYLSPRMADLPSGLLHSLLITFFIPAAIYIIAKSNQVHVTGSVRCLSPRLNGLYLVPPDRHCFNKNLLNISESKSLKFNSFAMVSLFVRLCVLFLLTESIQARMVRSNMSIIVSDLSNYETSLVSPVSQIGVN